jgi:hypothetical protein
MGQSAETQRQKTRRGMIFDKDLYRMCFARCVSIIYCKMIIDYPRNQHRLIEMYNK